ncbi:unnamed protein product [Rotaria magnacalcarata]|uniref:Uncharacterized protein n=1 Tax=Rotaria magnacalcarata TaxID=392030 RepID=A0A814YRP9_9BILA|nr:unnamed protein product [Rotaria magnacalcarata]CAF1507851.1 unnamed protein product [Rotaria magnacalcarata]CAF2133745.1 unnamed protein product [Rotaria magnacalcarata]CAF3821536.1 unnamed protein product [Rotaria magnacalcarata]CAF3848869.1 unnamed protein product [Rotaria magnacalcarata]
MPRNSNSEIKNDEQPFESKDFLTPTGYIKAVELCKNDSELIGCLCKEMDDIHIDIWRNLLSSRNMIEPVKYIFAYWDEQFERKKLEKNDIMKFIQIFSLLENVFRNVVLRSYIPAYRIINMNCGRYSSFVTKSDKQLFNMFKFRENPPNLLIYDGIDQIETILYAISCAVFWHSLSMKLTKVALKN